MSKSAVAGWREYSRYGQFTWKSAAAIFAVIVVMILLASSGTLSVKSRDEPDLLLKTDEVQKYMRQRFKILYDVEPLPNEYRRKRFGAKQRVEWRVDNEGGCFTFTARGFTHWDNLEGPLSREDFRVWFRYDEHGGVIVERIAEGGYLTHGP